MTIYGTYFLGTFSCNIGFLDMLHEVPNPIQLQETVIKCLELSEITRNIRECIQSSRYISNNGIKLV